MSMYVGSTISGRGYNISTTEYMYYGPSNTYP